MGWKPGPQRFHTIERIRASASGLPPERERLVREGVLRRALAEGLIPEHDADSWARSLEGDLWGTVDLLNEMADARRGNGNGSVAAAARRDDGEQLIASAVRAGKFRIERADYWRRRFAENPEQAAALIEALQPLPTFIAGKGKTDDNETLVGAVSPQAALRLGMAVRREHPLGPDLPGRVQVPPPPRRVNVIGDRS